jgi:predicted porin
MKKIIFLALVIAGVVATAGAAQAVTVYEKNGLTYKIKGDWQIQLRQDPGEDQNLEVEYDDLELKNTIEYDLQNGLRAIGQLDIGFKNAADAKTTEFPDGNDETVEIDDGPHLEEAYLGFGYKGFELVYGKTVSAADEFGIEGFIEAPVTEDAFNEAGAEDGDDLIKVSAEIAMINIIVAHELEAENESSENGSFTDVFLGAEFYGVSLGAAYQTLTPAGADDSIDTWGLSAAYDAKLVEIAADYSVASQDDIDTDLTVWNVFVSVPIKPVTLGAGYQLATVDVGGDEEDVASWCVNAVYKFPAQKNVSIFAEIANSDEDDSDMGYLVGTRIKF